MPNASQKAKAQAQTGPSAKPRATVSTSTFEKVSANPSPSTTRKRKASFRLDDAISLIPNHQLTEYLHHTSSLVKEIEEMNKELNTSEARAVLQKLANRGRVLERIEHRKEVLSIGIYMQPKHTQSMLIQEYRRIFEEDPFPRVCGTDFDSDDDDPPTPKHAIDSDPEDDDVPLTPMDS
ncbi:hypothetical protein N7451_009185 [Penicillium sp. IBT 35674x]|nr:hypothetical protein N7451_009185 [Penicillium sp. IBT 35674x]